MKIEDRQEETLLTNRKVFQSVGEIEQLSKYDKKLLINFPGGISQKISEMAEAPMVFEAALFITNESLNGVVKKVKNCLLEWTLKLEEEGILGEGMLFSEKEAASAKILSNQTNNYFGTVIQGSVSNSQIVSGNSNAVTYNVDKLFTAIEDISKSLEMENMTKEGKDSALEILEVISSKIGQNKKAGIIKSALVGLKDFTLSAGASVTAALIATQLQTLF